MEIKNLTGGLIRGVSADSLNSNQVQDAQNVSFTEELGCVKTRRGITRYGSLVYKYATSIFWQNTFTPYGIVAFGGKINGIYPDQTVTDGYPDSDAPVLWLHDRVIPFRFPTLLRDYSSGGGGGGSVVGTTSTDAAAFIEYGNWIIISDGNDNIIFNNTMQCKPFGVWTYFWEYTYLRSYFLSPLGAYIALQASSYGAFIWASETGDPETSEYWCTFEWEKEQLEGSTVESDGGNFYMFSCEYTDTDLIAGDTRNFSLPTLLGISVPLSAPLPATGAAGVLSGTYTYKVTFVDADGFESNESPESDEVSPSSEKVELTYVPLSGDPFVVARRIYRNENGGAEWKRVGEIDNNYDTTFSDNIADAELGATIPDANYLPPPFCALSAHNSLVWGIRSVYPDEVWYSNSKSQWKHFDINNYEEFGVLPKNTRALISYNGYLVIVQGVDIYLYNTRVQPAIISKAPIHGGIATGRAAFDLGDSILLGSMFGVRRFGDSIVALSTGIKVLFDRNSSDSYRLDESYLSNIRIVSNGDDVLISYTKSGDTVNGNTIHLKLDGKVESIIPQGFIDFAVDRETDDIYGLKSDYKIYRLLSGSDDDGTDIDWYFQTKEYAIEYLSIVNAKQGLKAKIDCNPNGGTITVEVYMDGSSAQTRTITGSARTTMRWKLPDKTFHRISYKISGSGEQYFYGISDNIIEGEI